MLDGGRCEESEQKARMNKSIVLLLLMIAVQLVMTGCRDKKLSEQERKEAELRQCCAEIEQGIKSHFESLGAGASGASLSRRGFPLAFFMYSAVMRKALSRM